MVVASSTLLGSTYSVGNHHWFIFDPFFIKTHGEMLADEKVDMPEISVTQEDSDLLIKLVVSNLNVNDLAIEIKDGRLVAQIPTERNTVKVTLYNDKQARCGVMYTQAYVKTIQEKKDDKGVVISHSSGVAHVEQSQLLPALMGDLNNVRAEYKNGILIIHIPVHKEQLPKKINVEVCDIPGSK